MSYICKCCGKEFDKYKTANGSYYDIENEVFQGRYKILKRLKMKNLKINDVCSYQCLIEYGETLTKCPCGKWFFKKKTYQKYCSNECVERIKLKYNTLLSYHSSRKKKRSLAQDCAICGARIVESILCVACRKENIPEFIIQITDPHLRKLLATEFLVNGEASAKEMLELGVTEYRKKLYSLYHEGA